MHRDIALAWHVANFSISAQAGKLPELKAVMAQLTPPPLLTTAHQGAVVAAWSDIMGIQARPLSEAAQRALARQKERRG